MGPQTRFLNNPQYQRAVQIMSRMDPSRRAILDTVIADKHFASEEMRNKLMLMKMGYEKERGKKSHKLAKRRLDTSMDLQRRGLDIEEGYVDYLGDRADTANMLGWGNIGISGLRGYAELQDKQQYTDWLKRERKLYRR